MIRYELYDKYGKKITEHIADATDCGTLILQFGREYFRPIHYDLNSTPYVAKCVPVEVIKCRGQKR